MFYFTCNHGLKQQGQGKFSTYMQVP